MEHYALAHALVNKDGTEDFQLEGKTIAARLVTAVSLMRKLLQLVPSNQRDEKQLQQVWRH